MRGARLAEINRKAAIAPFILPKGEAAGLPPAG